MRPTLHLLRCFRQGLVTLALAALAGASAAAEGGLYIAGDGFTFQQAAERGLAQNPGGRRFFLLTLPTEAAALGSRATPAQQRLRDRVLAANGVLLVCQRDLDGGRISAEGLASGVVAVRGNSSSLPADQRNFGGEDPSQLPSANKALRRLRAACS